MIAKKLSHSEFRDISLYPASYITFVTHNMPILCHNLNTKTWYIGLSYTDINCHLDIIENNSNQFLADMTCLSGVSITNKYGLEQHCSLGTKK